MAKLNMALLLLGLVAAGAVAQELGADLPTALELDGECAAGNEACSLNALQLKAAKQDAENQAEKAQQEAKETEDKYSKPEDGKDPKEQLLQDGSDSSWYQGNLNANGKPYGNPYGGGHPYGGNPYGDVDIHAGNID
jgi:hypothetical protein